jgi:hypothetical protein
LSRKDHLTIGLSVTHSLFTRPPDHYGLLHDPNTPLLRLIHDHLRRENISEIILGAEDVFDLKVYPLCEDRARQVAPYLNVELALLI